MIQKVANPITFSRLHVALHCSHWAKTILSVLLWFHATLVRALRMSSLRRVLDALNAKPDAAGGATLLRAAAL
jgi:hypothetical protein